MSCFCDKMKLIQENIFLGMVDSSFTIGAVLEKRLLPMPFTLSLSGSMNHRNGQFRLGCGFVLG